MTLALALARVRFPSLLDRFMMLAGAGVSCSSLVDRTRLGLSHRRNLSSFPFLSACTCVIGANSSAFGTRNRSWRRNLTNNSLFVQI